MILIALRPIFLLAAMIARVLFESKTAKGAMFSSNLKIKLRTGLDPASLDQISLRSAPMRLDVMSVLVSARAQTRPWT